MAWNLKKRTVEYIIYFLFWGVLLLSPFLGGILDGSDYTVEWGEILTFWGYLLPAIIIFFVNNNLLMPLLLYGKKGRRSLLYMLCVVVACCLVYIFSPLEPHGKGGPPDKHRHVHDMGQRPRGGEPHGPVGTGHDGAPLGPRESVSPFYSEYNSGVHPRVSEPAVYEIPHFPPERHDRKLLFTISHPKNVQVLIVVFVIVFNVCVRLFFFTLRRDENYKELEKARLKAELDYLKFQVNPHFFMNSLNNIHALVDIDKEKAQKAIVELSKMMRHLLYGASELFVPLEKELTFLNSYIDLMRLRYTGKVKLNISFPKETNGVNIPPLLLLQFVENAFKHGVTYKQETIIDVSLDIDREKATMLFACSNTYVKGTQSSVVCEKGGIGVENARKRLELIFGEKASMNVLDNGEVYKVVLKIPYNNDKVYNS